MKNYPEMLSHIQSKDYDILGNHPLCFHGASAL